MEKHDVVIVGAGPAGLKAAEVLAGAGKDVLVLEKNDVVGPKVCAGGITLKDIKMGIPEELFERKFAPVIKVGKNSLRFNEEEAKVITVSRKKLGQWQKKIAEDAGAIVQTGTMVKKIEKDYIVTNKGDVGFDYLIGADGTSSQVRRALGIKTRKLIMGMQYVVKQKFDDLILFPGFNGFRTAAYAWIFPYKDVTSIGCGACLCDISSKQLKEDFCRWLEEQNIDVGEGKFEAFPINHDYQGFEFGNVYLAGDAAGFASGLTGEGIYFALASGEDVAHRILDSDYDTRCMDSILMTKKKHEFLVSLWRKSSFFRKSLLVFALYCVKNNRFLRKFAVKYLLNLY